MAPFLRSSNPLLEKRWEKRGEVYKKRGNDTDQTTENPANLIPAKYQSQKTAGNTVITLVTTDN